MKTQSHVGEPMKTGMKATSAAESGSVAYVANQLCARSLECSVEVHGFKEARSFKNRKRMQLPVPGRQVVECNVCARSKDTMQSQERPRRSHVQAQCPVRPVPTALVVSDARVLLASMELRKLCARSSAQLHVLKGFIARKELPHRSNVALQMCIVLFARSTQFRHLKFSAH
ncbi:hypothetical protein PI124_g19685 [Phytophthora idaei]|nr:hypothetical protein PI125_g20830 [Phytophthora idaei]KAG3133455.1 hypothetical protein PI126_g19174 [Phytophthora idaei]KAG3235279.1 hypothetical protein PI124_g19685 [Phytophthora idaei]